MQINVHRAKTHLSKLLEKVSTGEEIIIAKAGKPVARLVPIEGKIKSRTLGSARGKFKVPADFNHPLPKEIEDSFWR